MASPRPESYIPGRSNSIPPAIFQGVADEYRGIVAENGIRGVTAILAKRRGWTTDLTRSRIRQARLYGYLEPYRARCHVCRQATPTKGNEVVALGQLAQDQEKLCLKVATQTLDPVLAKSLTEAAIGFHHTRQLLNPAITMILGKERSERENRWTRTVSKTEREVMVIVKLKKGTALTNPKTDAEIGTVNAQCAHALAKRGLLKMTPDTEPGRRRRRFRVKITDKGEQVLRETQPT